jgi:hypothetical protein
MKFVLRSTALLLLVVGSFLSTASAESAAVAHNPAKVQYSSQRQALLAASSFAKLAGGSLILTSGTHSMEPLIHGKTYVVIVKRPYAAIAQRDLLVYRGRPNANQAATTIILHRAVLHDSYGWLMSGDNNRWSESWDRVTSDNYSGTVVAIFAFPQA